MKTQTIRLSEQEITEQKKYADKYYNLILKELNYGDLCNLENIAKYSQSYKHHMALFTNPYIEMPIAVYADMNKY